MNLFNTSGSVPMMPRSPQVPQMPFGFGLSTITDFIGLTEPSTPIPQQASPSSQRRQETQNFSQNQRSTESQQTRARINERQFDQQQQFNQNRYSAPTFTDKQYQVPISMATFSMNNPSLRDTTTQVSQYNSQYSQSHLEQIPTQNTEHFGTSSPPNSSQVEDQRYQQFQALPAKPISAFAPSVSSSASLTVNQGDQLQPPLLTSTLEQRPPPPALVVPVTTTSEDVVHDLTRRSASPTSSGVQIDLINLRQKLTRDIQNNMDTVTEQQKNIKLLHNRADIVETENARLKSSLDDLKRRHREQKEKLDETECLIKSALTMSSFSLASSLHIEMTEAENECDTTLFVIAKESQ